MQALESVLGVGFVVSELALLFLTPVVLLGGVVVWTARLVRVRSAVTIGALCLNAVALVTWAALFAPVFLGSSASLPSWLSALDVARGPVYWLTLPAVVVADVLLDRDYRRSTRETEPPTGEPDLDAAVPAA